MIADNMQAVYEMPEALTDVVGAVVLDFDGLPLWQGESPGEAVL